MSDQQILERLIVEFEELRNEQRRFMAQKPLFTILNTNLPASWAANQDNYDPGNYDLLYIDQTAARNLSGISGGVAGRALWLRNSSSFNLAILNNSGLSSAGNRIFTKSGATLTLTPNGVVLLVYSSISGGRWFELLSNP